MSRPRAAALLLVLALAALPPGRAQEPQEPLTLYVHFPGGVPRNLEVGDGWAGGIVVWANRPAHGIAVRYADPDDYHPWVIPSGVTVHQEVRFQALETGASFTPDDPLWSQQYGPALIRATSVWDTTLGSAGITVAVVDTGVDLQHPDLVPNLWTNPGEVAGNGLDDDGNGKTDDVRGWDFAVDAPGGDADPDDLHGHGTHVAGTVAAVIDNGVGIAGVANVRVMAVRVLNVDGAGTLANVTDGITYAAGAGADIISLSLGGSSGSPILAAAVAAANASGALVIAAAGNDGGCCVNFPAAYPEAVAVAAVDAVKQRASFSSTGPKVELSGPGVGIVSTLPPCDGPDLCSSTGYGSLSGTSMATPHVSGAAALLLSYKPTLANWQVRAILVASADDLFSPGRDTRTGFGLVNLLEAFRCVDAPAVHVGALTFHHTSLLHTRFEVALVDEDGMPGRDLLVLWGYRTPAGYLRLGQTMTDGAGVAAPELGSVSRFDGPFTFTIRGIGSSLCTSRDAAADVASEVAVSSGPKSPGP